MKNIQINPLSPEENVGKDNYVTYICSYLAHNTYWVYYSLQRNTMITSYLAWDYH